MYGSDCIRWIGSLRKAPVSDRFVPQTASLPLLIILLSAGAIGLAQQPQSGAPSGLSGQLPAVEFRAETNFVEINAVVTDERGDFVKDLTRDDFEIAEDGKPQSPSVFALVDLPIERPATAVTSERTAEPIESDVRSTTRNFDGRLYMLLLDDLQTSAQRSQLVRDSARRFIRQYLGADDLAAVLNTSGRNESQQELTSSRRLLLAAIDRFQGRKLPSAGVEKLAVHLRHESLAPRPANDDPGVISSPNLDGARQTVDPEDAERAQNARFMLRALEELSKRLTDIHGRRKAVVLFSEGVDYDIYQPFSAGSSSASVIVQDAQNAVAAAQRANVAVYAIDPRGLNQLGGESIDVRTPSTSLPQLDFGTLRGFAQEMLLAQESLISLAEETGGLAVINANDMAAGLARIAQDNSRYYLLGYFTDPTRSPGRFRSISVKVKHSGLRVRARKGYVPPDPKAATRAREIEAKSGTSPTLRAALNNPLPVGTLPLRVFAAPFKGSGRNASVLVAVEIDGSAITFTQADGISSGALEVSIAAVDRDGKVQGGDRQNLGLKLQPQMYERVSRTGLRFLSRINLPPARYQIRVGAAESVGKGVGTVPYDLEVPDYSKSTFMLSGLALTSSSANAYVTTAPDPLLKDILSPAPTAARAFDRQEQLVAFVELYVTPGPAPTRVEFVATVRSAANGRIFFSTRDTRALETSTRSLTHGFKAEVPLSNLDPGMYVLRVEAASTAKDQSVDREIPFEVR